MVEAHDALTPAMQKVYNQWCKIEGKVVSEALDAARKQGKLIHEVVSHPDKYEGGSISTLAEAIGCAPDVLYKLQAFAEKYTDTEYANLCAQQNRLGRKLTVSHVYALLSVTDKAARTRWQKSAITNNWSAKQLQQAIIAAQGSQRPGAGRKLSQPSNLMDGARNSTAFLEEFARRSEQVWGPMFDTFGEIPPDEVDLTTRQRLQDLLDAENAAIEACSSQKELTLAALAKVDRVLQEKGLLQDNAAADEEAGDDAEADDDTEGDDSSDEE
jgi:hypothetical protein